LTVTYSIRPVQEADAASIIEILNPIIAAGMYSIMDKPFAVADQIEFIRGFPARGIYHIAVEAESQKAVGIQDVMPISSSDIFKYVGEISTFVALDAHQQGIGRSLSQATFKAAKRLGFLKLRANVRGDNAQALLFYRSQGFEHIGVAQKQAFLHGRYVDEILVERFLK
jgi:L-amino acid N-acyltransferase YncA